ncbi:MarR family winged helix-turn-helix transcriptional regulator [Clostridium algidicarnis]|uniref:MarR family transcriptional regulator n=2 Tax=Clostridium algidicarnis TaxID=37659 RepID=A0A2S6FX69_9CLOT|nr:MarR family transcriptional regulator [Clostridium algidicarnis]MBB6630320.1 MarR family transcriptional regulator [Clostridium algidicarnis]MBB6697738.1 MarR family transcriptional regulator [Clostridium algidicarnis]MBU3192864.1 MarR family transcriptional regulator [Clostridium algidicarnis]MBU3195240.1 MarR family transcriptional regulator [Clostridium algidicarnis]MBU3203545.1 MarR family transcriptional regulator [Clostridium algidicarnis]
MNKSISTINELLVETFNDILTIEQNAINSGAFKDISVTEVHTIDAIGMYEPRTMTEVAKELDITVGTLTIAINNLVKKEYVERKKSAEDRRLVMVQLTKKGKLAYRIHEKFHSDMVKATIEGLTKEEEETLVKSLENLNSFFREKYNLKNGKKRE